LFLKKGLFAPRPGLKLGDESASIGDRDVLGVASSLAMRQNPPSRSLYQATVRGDLLIARL
jgi:hypothetical protein